MPFEELQSSKYLDYAPEYAEYGDKPPQGRLSKLGGLLFRSVLILGLVGAVYWFYRNQDPILANIRNNSGDYQSLFSSLIKTVNPDGSNEFLSELPDATSVSHSPQPQHFVPATNY